MALNVKNAHPLCFAAGDPKVGAERAHRLALWSQLQAVEQESLKPALLRDLKVFYGGRGIWVDKTRTAGIGGSAYGVTVSLLLHTGSSYADDLFDDCVLCHYPQTATSGRDAAEVEATRAASELKLPVFVITYPSPKSPSRRVRLGWIEDWDDAKRWFLITFGESAPDVAPQPDDDVPFPRMTGKNRDTRPAKRPNQARFKFQVFRRYGAACAVCGLDVPEVLEAAHIIPDEDDGPDDPRNGLVLCRNHHRAYDCGLFLIEPDTLALRYVRENVSAASLVIARTSLQHLSRKPHTEALRWRWDNPKRRFHQ